MSSRYSIIQYVPNPIADERINIGIVAFNDRLVKTKFVKSWKRIRCFAINESDIDCLKEFQSKVEKLASLGLLFSNDVQDKNQNLERLNKISRSWGNSIQLTIPRGSLSEPETLLKEIAEDLLIEPLPIEAPVFRDRQAAVKVVRGKIREMINGFGKEAQKFYKKDYELQGSLSNNKFDVAVVNGKPFFAAQGISFEVQTSEKTISSTSWKVSDVKKFQPNTPIAIIALPPKQESPYFERTKELYEDCIERFRTLDADVIEEKDVESWASDRLGEDFKALISRKSSQ